MAIDHCREKKPSVIIGKSKSKNQIIKLKKSKSQKSKLKELKKSIKSKTIKPKIK